MSSSKVIIRKLMFSALIAAVFATLLSQQFKQSPEPIPGLRTLALGKSNSLSRTLASVPLMFEANIGQYATTAPFVARGKGYALAVSPAEATIELPSLRNGQNAPKKPTTVRTCLVGANPNAVTHGEKPFPTKLQHFTGGSPSNWKTEVAIFEQIRTKEIYTGIDLVHYGNRSGDLEYDFELKPQANPTEIKLRIDGRKT
jgi:hypothetical protein